ncbi:CPBP family intramembrane metalloprotease [Crocinitomix catalasitica]|nr:CPBP family intramembrane metalloprotease [Crocinitomix catalasitica]
MWNAPGFLKTWSYMWGPGIAAIIVLLLFRKKHPRTITFFGTSTIKSLAFWFLPLFALAIPGIENSSGINPHLYPVLILGLIGFLTILGEELGWRGFLQDALRPLPTIPKYLLIGFLWEIWHFTNRMSRGELPQVVIKVAIWVLALSVLSFIMGKATDKSKSVIVAVTIHAWVNLTAEHPNLWTFVVLGISILFWMVMLWTWDRPIGLLKKKELK